MTIIPSINTGWSLLKRNVNHTKFNKTEIEEYWKKDNIEILVYYSEFESNSSPVSTVIKFDGKKVQGCIECRCSPELRMDKKTKLFYCTCPSSFYGNDCEDIPVKQKFRTIKEAVDDWNRTNDCSCILEKMQPISKYHNEQSFLNDFYKYAQELHNYAVKPVYAKLNFLQWALNLDEIEIYEAYKDVEIAQNILVKLEKQFLEKFYFINKQKN